MPKEADLIEQHQFTFVKNSSTTAALIRKVDSWKLAIREGLYVLLLTFEKRLM